MIFLVFISGVCCEGREKHIKSKTNNCSSLTCHWLFGAAFVLLIVMLIYISVFSEHSLNILWDLTDNNDSHFAFSLATWAGQEAQVGGFAESAVDNEFLCSPCV